MNIKEIFGIEYPIIQGCMANIAIGEFAAAVSNAGGLGLIGAGGMTAEILRENIRKCKSLTDKPFGVNIMLMNPEADKMAEVVVEEGVKIVTTGAGFPSKFMPVWKEAGIFVMPVVSSAMIAKKMEKEGADAVIAEGTESGGHIGENTTMCLVPQVVDAVEIPVIAAGGIADGRGMAASFMLGAEGVQIGTRFLASEECQIHPTFKELVIGAKDTDSIVTGRYTGHPCRNVKTKFAKKLAMGEKDGTLTPDEFENLTLGALRRAVVDGDVDSGSFLCGAIAGMINEIKSCADIVKEINDGAEKLLKL